MEFYSHPEKKLISHLIEVRDIAVSNADKDLKASVALTALCHDFGKYTTYFQQHLRNKKQSIYSQHSFISSLFAAFCSIKQFGEDSPLPLFIYNAVLHHHGSLECISENLPDNIRSFKASLNLIGKIDILYKQIEDMKRNYDFICKDLETIIMCNYFEEFLKTDYREILMHLKRLDFMRERKADWQDYFIHQTIYSCLIDADKLSASGAYLPSPLYLPFIELEKNKNAIFNNQEGDMSKLRTEIYDKVLKNIMKYYSISNIFTITAPTGTGKTLTGFMAALKLKEITKLRGKVIYCLPFTSIIDQSFSAIENIYSLNEDFSKNSSRYLLKHHHLTNKEYDSEEYEPSANISEMLFETWASGVIITTFVQLFETLISNNNRMLKKFNDFYNSVILIDEIQAIDINYFNLIEYVLKKACEFFNCRIILMTATKPLIFEDAVELLPDNEKYFKKFNRNEMTYYKNEMEISHFIDFFVEKYSIDKSFLVVCNTIKESIEVYKMLKEVFVDKYIYYLSTNIIPKERRERLEKIKNDLNNGKKPIVVSTQVVEAGVDLDFDVVIRDIAPFDSIVQCAGRCNRNSTNPEGKVWVVKLKDNDGNLFARKIYSKNLVNITLELLEKNETIKEENYYNIIYEYFKKVKENKSSDISDKFIKTINRLIFSSDNDISNFSIDKFHIISYRGMYIDVIVRLDDKIEKVYEKLQELLTIKEYNQKHELYLQIRNIIKDYTISVPYDFYKKFMFENNIFSIPYDNVNDLYDKETGFRRSEEETFMVL